MPDTIDTEIQVDRLPGQQRQLIGSLEPLVGLTEVLGERYLALQTEMGDVNAHTVGEATAATNYYRGRVDELNLIKTAIAEHNQSITETLPTIERSEIQFGYQAQEHGHRNEMEISR